ncbi:sensor histidine kinase [Albibacterium bauzanense]|uniref:histidine kinase n=1 Tax=Albibacterium bauzanense TaxID=653929 RepID=A0A4R1LVV7_9SPHI|nr:HAMP domain-containing sensor histidine kinase [Albibacterium bauzanense]TCK82992.1 two-component system phosphate regulon sensor histidine kinase PhoR [Albibacterium bauzanense]
MNRKSISLIIGLMSVALLGVMAMQYYFIRQSYHLKTQLFDESVMAAINTVALKVEKDEALRFLNNKESRENKARENQENEARRSSQEEESTAYANRMRMKQAKLRSDFKALEQQVKRRYPGAVLLDNDFYETYMKDPVLRSHVKYEVTIQQAYDEAGRVFQQQEMGIYADRKASQIIKAKDDSVRYFIVDPIVGEFVISLPPRVDAKLEGEIRQLEQQAKVRMASVYMDSVKASGSKEGSALENLADEFERSKKSVMQRIDPKFMEEELRQELKDREIALAFNFNISNGKRDSIMFQFASNKAVPDVNEAYTTVLFPSDLSGERAVLSVFFPDKSSLLMGNMKVMLISSATLLLVLIACFTFTILSIIKQKKLSAMKSDFMNNMTHEFKTPVATIMIASESLKDSEISQDQSRVARLAGIIYDENIRLGNHIERVLNIARIEKGDLKLESEPIDINDLIGTVVDSMALQLQKNKVEIEFDLNTEPLIVLGDELHLSNVIFNLIDNSIKYTNHAPHIYIQTRSHGNHVNIILRDNGMGMNRDQLSKIFDQFYRIPTGNIHDVKGFGLGLSYVQDIIKRIGGTIKVKSEINKGAEFEITIPLYKP